MKIASANKIACLKKSPTHILADAVVAIFFKGEPVQFRPARFFLTTNRKAIV